MRKKGKHSLWCPPSRFWFFFVSSISLFPFGDVRYLFLHHWPSPRLFGFSSVFLVIILLWSYMMTSNTDDPARLVSHRSPPTSIHGLVSHLPPDDPTSASYIPRAARTIPTSTTVHSVFIKKLSYPLSNRSDELWIVERTLDGIETWKPVETFLENMHLTNDQATVRTTANHWRRYYDVPIQSSSSSPTATTVPVLPHPEHSNVYVSQPYEAIPDHLHILQSCWGRSAQHHSQGTTTSLYWPPWRSTPPSSPSATLQRTVHLTRPAVHPQQVHGPLDANDMDPMDMSDSSV